MYGKVIGKREIMFSNCKSDEEEFMKKKLET